jgi:cobalamin 5'-phosphate synthase/cobalamin synthase
VAVSFLTLVPVTSGRSVCAEDIGRSARWFPLVGALIGCVYVIVLRAFSPVFPALVVAVLILITEALLTGALHLDGLADMADGFGGGRTREDVLRIMRDHAIGAYGAMALILLVVLKGASIAALIDRHRADPYLIVAPALGRWSGVFLTNLLPYARRTEREGMTCGGAVSDFVGRWELFIATVTALLLTVFWRDGEESAYGSSQSPSACGWPGFAAEQLEALPAIRSEPVPSCLKLACCLSGWLQSQNGCEILCDLCVFVVSAAMRNSPQSFHEPAALHSG